MAEVMEWIKSLSNDELVQHLMNEYGYKCGPITVSTRSVYEKKLQSFKNHTTISGKTIPVSQQQTRTNGSSSHNHEEIDNEEDAVTKLYLSAGRSPSGSSPRKGRKSLPLPSSPSTRSKSSGDPMRDIKIPSSLTMQPKSRKAIDLNLEEDEEESKNQRRSSRRVTIASPGTTPKAVSGKKSLRISTPGPSSSVSGPRSLSTYSSAEEEEEDGLESEDQVNELPGHTASVFTKVNISNKSPAVGKPSIMKSPKMVTPTAQGMEKVRTSTPMTRMAINTSVFGNSSISSSIGRRGSSRTRIPSSLRVEPPSASSLASFSDDNESENEVGTLGSNNIDTPPSVNLLRYRPRSSGIVRGSSRVRTPLGNITTQATDENGMTRNKSLWSSFLSSSTASTASPSSWISITILVVALLFFFSIFSFYFYSRITSSSHVHPPSHVHSEAPSFGEDKVTTNSEDDAIIAKIKAPVCTTGQSGLDLCLKSKNHVRPALAVIRQVLLIFESQCIKHFCESSSDNHALPIHDPSFMSLDSFRFQLVQILTNSPSFLKLARSSLEVETGTGDEAQEAGVLTGVRDEGVVTLLLVNQAISDSLLLLQLNPEFKIKVVRGERSVISHLRIDLKTFPIQWPWMCRITMAIVDAIWILTIVSVVMFASFCLYYFINLSKKRRSEEEELKYELIEKSLELLQSPDEPQSMPILHIRDTLISPLDRTDPKNIRVWNEVVRFIEENESRVKIDSEVIDGETYRTWKWVASQVSIDGSSSPFPGSIKTGDIEWQGQAFNENDAAKSTPTLSRKSMSKPSSPSTGTMEPFVAPTAFIKARNFFDIEQVRNSSDSSWTIPIKNAILQKCSLRAPDGDHGILHMVFDSDHPREALVYMRCKNIDSATNAYLALHGWWCERRLVSVRFLKDDRYYQRFPDARHSSTSLKCTE